MTRNFLVIFGGKILDVVSKEGNFVNSDFDGTWDTIAEDPSGAYKAGDDYDVDILISYNPEYKSTSETNPLLNQ